MKKRQKIKNIRGEHVENTIFNRFVNYKSINFESWKKCRIMLSAGGSLFWLALSYIFEGFSSASDYWIDSTFRVLTFSKEGFRFFVICWSNFTLFNQSSKIAISWCLKRKLRFSAIKIDTQCLKITEKVSFDEFLKSLASNSVTRQVSFNWPKIDGKCQLSKMMF